MDRADAAKGKDSGQGSGSGTGPLTCDRRRGCHQSPPRLHAKEGSTGQQMGSKRLEPLRNSHLELTRRPPNNRMNSAARVCIVVHVATAEVVCHAGGRGFESRRSRSKSRRPGRFFAVPLGTWMAVAQAARKR
jgi:hypothetical protein